MVTLEIFQTFKKSAFFHNLSEYLSGLGYTRCYEATDNSADNGFFLFFNIIN